MDDLNLPVDIQLELFDTMVLPVVMYGCEVWSFEKNNILESFCLQFYKILLGLKKVHQIVFYMVNWVVIQ